MAANLLAETEESTDSPWDVSLAVGATVTRGNRNTITSNGSLEGRRERDVHLFRCGIEAAYGRAEIEDEEGQTQSDTTVKNGKAFVHYKRTHDGSYTYAESSVFHDDIAKIDYRALAGVGLGYHLYESDAVSLGVEGGAGYLAEEVDDMQDDYPVLRIAQRLDWALSELSRLWQQAEYIPKANDLGQYLLNSEAGLEAPLNRRTNLRVVLQDRYDSEPEGNVEKNDLSLITYLAWKL